MQKSLKEIIKQIAALEQQKEEIMSDESQNSITRYGSNEEIPESDYNFSAVRNEIERLDSTIRYLRHRLHHSNATVLVPEFKITIGECIIMMAQLGKEKATLTRMARRGKNERRLSNFSNAVEWIAINYDKDECRRKLKEISDKITSLQIAIDRINLTHVIAVEVFD